MFKRLISSILVVTMFVGSLTAYAIEHEPIIEIQENNVSSNISALPTESESLPHISSENMMSMTMNQSSPLALSSVEEKEYEEIQITPEKNIQFDTDVTIPATVYNSDGYVSLNKLEPGDYIDDGIVIDGEMTVCESDLVSSRAVPSSMDMAYRLGNMNAKDSFALQNQTGRTNFIGDNLGEEYVDPMTGNLVVTETDLVLPGVDGLDLNLARYYSAAEAELYTKTAGIEANGKTYAFPEGGGFQVTETKRNTETNETETYNYFYLTESQADRRVEEIETRDTEGGLFYYTASKIRKYEDDTVYVDYNYTSEISSVSYQQSRNNLGAGWSWCFPSVQVIKDNIEDINEIAKAIYYHDGKGNTMEVEFVSGEGYSFANYVGKDITFTDYFDYAPDICSVTRIDYIVDNPDGTKYYFGKHGEIRTIVDRYGNKITFNYTEKDFYGVNDSLMLSSITDTVGRVVRFDYSDEYITDGEVYENITVTVSEPGTAEIGLTLEYEKLMADVYDPENNYISTEPILMHVTNAVGEKTHYYPTWESGSRYLYFPIQFSFADKSFDSDFVYNTTGYKRNMVYLLGNIVRPHSDTYYFYDIRERNLGHSGVCEAYVVKERGEYEHVVEPTSDGGLRYVEYHDKNVVEYDYYRDYTGYGFHNSIESIDDDYSSYIVRTREHSNNATHNRYFYKIQDAVLEKDGSIVYSTPVGNALTVNYENLYFSQKQPTRTRLDYSNGDGYSYISYVQKSLNNAVNKAYGKPTLITEEVDYETVIGQDREKHSICYEYYADTGFVQNKSWYRDDNTQCFEYYRYNDKQRPSSIRKADGSAETYVYEYNTSGKVTKRITTTTNDSGTTIIEENYTAATGYAYPSSIVKKVSENGITKAETMAYTYDMLLGLVESITDEEGNVTRFEYDKLSRPTRIIYPKHLVYTSYGNKNGALLPVENISYTTVRKDNYGNKLTSDEDLLCQMITNELTYYITTDNTPAYPTDAELSGHSYTYYDNKTNLYMGTRELIESNVIDTVNNTASYLTTSYVYDSDANTVTEIDPQGNSKVTYYDGLGREVKTVDIFGNHHITEYNIASDGAGFKARCYFAPATNTLAKENVIEYTYDRVGRIINERAYENYQDNSFVEKKYTYDIAGNLIGVIDANENLNAYGFTQSIKYDKLNRAIKITNAQNGTITNAYDNDGNIKTQKISDSNGNESTLYQRVYDGEGKLVTDTDNAGNSNTYTYDNMGRLWQSVDKDGKIYNPYYNALDGLERENYIKVNETLTDRQYQYANPHGADFVFDARGSYSTTTQGYTVSLKEIVRNTYSRTGKLISHLDDFKNDVTNGGNIYFNPYERYTYDALGNITTALYGCAESESQLVYGIPTYYEYDKNRISRVQVDGSIDKNAADSSNANYEFYPDGKLKSITFPALSDGNVLKTEYTYDGLSRLATLTNTKGTTVLSSYSYTYDKNGNILTTNETVEGVSNTVTYGYDKLNRIATVGGTKGADSYYEYDYRGNRKVNFEQIDFLSEESAQFRYNEQDQMYYAEVGDDAVYIEYDASGYRYVKESSSSGIEYYIYDQNGRLQAIADLAEVIANGTTQYAMCPVKQYIWGPDRVLAQVDKETGEIYYYIYNGHGDVVQIVDRNGNIKNRYDYDVWGNFLTKDETIENHFTYFGQTYDEETGLYYLRARYYDPTTGRFTQQDPAEDGYNWYVYGNQNPVMYVDGNGESATAAAIGAILYEAAPYIAAAGAALVVGTVNFYKEHSKNKSKKNWDKHTKRRPGDLSKAQKKPGWQNRSNKRPK